MVCFLVTGLGYRPRAAFALRVTAASGAGGAKLTEPVAAAPHSFAWVPSLCTMLESSTEKFTRPWQMGWTPSM